MLNSRAVFATGRRGEVEGFDLPARNV